MIKKVKEWIIDWDGDLKDPFMCYSLMMRWMEEEIEDYVDQNEGIVRPVPFIMWLNGRKYITIDQADKLLNDEKLYLQRIITGKILFPCTYGRSELARDKSYQLLAEYISCFDGLRKRLYRTAINNFYKNEDGISLACIIPTGEFVPMEHPTPKKKGDMWDWSYVDRYEKVKSMSIAETDVKLED